MTLDTTKIIRIFLALVFLTAGIFRIFNPQMAVIEFTDLNLPLWLAWPTIVFEIIAGLSLMFNKYTKYIYWLLIGFLIFILIWAFIINGSELISGAGELFVFRLTPTDVFLHFVFLVMVGVLVREKLK
jgi:uncharacterized membrane protein YphA (DoxX/SURF4 family)